METMLVAVFDSETKALAALGGLVCRRELTDVADENYQTHVAAIKRRRREFTKNGTFGGALRWHAATTQCSRV